VIPPRVYYTYTFPDPIWRTIAMEIGLSLMSLADRFHPETPDITIRDHIGWVINDLAAWLFGAGYKNSGAEMASALNGESPWKYMSPIQRRVVVQEFGENPPLDDCGNVDNSRPLYLLTYPQDRRAE
jgi:hypothetical protein